MEKLGFSKSDVRENVLRNEFNYITTTYYLLVRKKMRRGYESVSDLKSHLYVNFIKDKHNLLKDYEFNIENVVYERANSKNWIKKYDNEENIDSEINKNNISNSNNENMNNNINQNNVISNNNSINHINNANEDNSNINNNISINFDNSSMNMEIKEDNGKISKKKNKFQLNLRIKKINHNKFENGKYLNLKSLNNTSIKDNKYFSLNNSNLIQNTNGKKITEDNLSKRNNKSVLNRTTIRKRLLNKEFESKTINKSLDKNKRETLNKTTYKSNFNDFNKNKTRLTSSINFNYKSFDLFKIKNKKNSDLHLNNKTNDNINIDLTKKLFDKNSDNSIQVNSTSKELSHISKSTKEFLIHNNLKKKSSITKKKKFDKSNIC